MKRLLSVFIFLAFVIFLAGNVDALKSSVTTLFDLTGLNIPSEIVVSLVVLSIILALFFVFIFK